MGMDSAEECSHENKESISMRSGIKEILSFIGHERPVVMFARAVEASEWFFVQETGEVVSDGAPLHDFHQHEIVITGEWGELKDGGVFVLGWGHFPMARMEGDAKSEGMFFHIGAEIGDAGR